MTGPGTSNRADGGFTLMEVLVAFLIMSMTIIYGMRIFGDGARRIADVELRAAELSQAREILALGATGQRPAGLTEQILQGEEVPWTPLRPHLLRSRAGESTLETIVLLPVQQ